MMVLLIGFLVTKGEQNKGFHCWTIFQQGLHLSTRPQQEELTVIKPTDGAMYQMPLCWMGRLHRCLRLKFGD